MTELAGITPADIAVKPAAKGTAAVAESAASPPNLKPPTKSPESSGNFSDHEKTDYSRLITIKPFQVSNVNQQGGVDVQERKEVVLSQEGRSAAGKIYLDLTTHDDPPAEVSALRTRILEHDQAPNKRVNNEEQRDFYGKLVEYGELQIRKQEQLQIKGEISSTGNGWEKVVRTKVLKNMKAMVVPQGLLPVEAKTWIVEQTQLQTDQARSEVASNIQQFRESLVSTIAGQGASKTERDVILGAVQLIEQKVLSGYAELHDPAYVYGKEAKGSSRDSRSYFIHLITEQLKKPEVQNATTDQAVEVVSQIKSPEDKVSKPRSHLAQKLISGAVALGLLAGAVSMVNPASARALDRTGHTVERVIQRVVEQPDVALEKIKNRIEYQLILLKKQYSKQHGLEVFEEEIKSVEESSRDLSFEERQTRKLAAILEKARLEDCMTVANLKSPQPEIVTGWSGESAGPIVIYNDEKLSESPICKGLFKDVVLPSDTEPVLKSSTLHPLDADGLARSFPDFAFTRGVKNYFRQLDITCFTTALATIANSEAEKRGEIGYSPSVISEIFRMALDVARNEDPGSYKDQPGVSSGLAADDLSWTNIRGDITEVKAFLNVLGVKTEVTPIDNSVMNNDKGQRLNMVDKDKTPEPKESWEPRSQKLVDQISELQKKGNIVIGIYQISPEYTHAVVILGTDVKNRKLLVLETANMGAAHQWEYTKNHKDVAGFPGVVKIPVDEQFIRAMNDAGHTDILSIAPGEKPLFAFNQGSPDVKGETFARDKKGEGNILGASPPPPVIPPT